jgi:hypothetical protein
MFECKICDYSSVRSTDLKRHEQTKKHIFKMCNTNSLIINNVDAVVIDENIETDDTTITNKVEKKQYVCDCKKIFKHRQGLFVHRKTCTYIVNNIDLYDNSKEQNIKLLNNNDTLAIALETITELKNSVDSMKAELCQLKNAGQIINNNTNNNTNSNNTTNNNYKTINVYTYVNSNYDQVEPLKLLKQKDIAKLLILDNTYSSKHSIEDVLVHEHDKHILNQFIGDIIVKEYKKVDPKDQKIWSSDASRLTFIVRTIISKNKVWNKDKGGVHINDFIITPILEEVKDMINEFNNECNKKIRLPKSDFNTLSDKISTSLKIIYEITTKKLHKSILNYIAPHFQLEVV